MDKQTLTKDEFEKLIKFESSLHTAMVGGYATGITKDNMELFNSILKAHNTNLPLNHSCNVCKINIMKELASLYFSYKINNNKKGEKKCRKKV